MPSQPQQTGQQLHHQWLLPPQELGMTLPSDMSLDYVTSVLGAGHKVQPMLVESQAQAPHVNLSAPPTAVVGVLPWCRKGPTTGSRGCDGASRAPRAQLSQWSLAWLAHVVLCTGLQLLGLQGPAAAEPACLSGPGTWVEYMGAAPEQRRPLKNLVSLAVHGTELQARPVCMRRPCWRP